MEHLTIEFKNNEILYGQPLNDVVSKINDIIDLVSEGYILKEVISTDITPTTSGAANIFYLATEGTYTHFGTSIDIPSGSIGIFKWNGSAWDQKVAKVCDPVSVSQNTDTGHTDINVGGNSYPVASVDEVKKLQDDSSLYEDIIGWKRVSAAALSSDYQLIKVSINQGEKFKVRVDVSGTYSRIIVVYNNDNSKRLVDSASTTDFIGNFLEITAPADITELGMFLSISGSATLTAQQVEDISNIADGAVTLPKINSSAFDDTPTLDSTKLIKSGSVFTISEQQGKDAHRLQEEFGAEFVSDIVTATNLRMLTGLNIKSGDIVLLKVDVEGDYTRIVLDANNNTGNQIRDTNNTSLPFVNVGWTSFTAAYSINCLGLFIVGEPTSAKISIKSKSAGNTKTEIDYLTEKIGKRINSELINSTTTSALTGLNILEGDVFYLKVNAIASYTRIVVNYNNDTNKRLFDSLSDTSFIGNYAKVIAPANITQIGLYFTGGTFYQLSIQTNVFYPTDLLKGKKWYACGDSFTAGGWSYKTSQNSFQDKPYRGEYKVYPFFIARRTGIDVVNMAVGGMSMCANRSGGDDNSFTASGTETHPSPLYQSIGEDADYITLYFGINDNNYGCPLGEITDTDNQSFYGAWNEVLTWLVNNRPNAKIGIVITNGSAPRFTAAERELAKRYGIPYLDLELDVERVPYLIRQYERTVSGGGDMLDSIAAIRDNDNAVDWQGTPINGHPNEKCHELESTIIENWLRSL